jgi:hypothetical protein
MEPDKKKKLIFGGLALAVVAIIAIAVAIPLSRR